jgi:PAS domain S-box-containing protein
LEELSGRHILVVEDEKGQAQVISFLFKNAFDADVVVAETCADARDQLETTDFDLITMDYQLPDGNGLDLLEEIQKKPGAPPVIMVTGHGDEATAVSAFKLGASGYVVKDKRMSTMMIEEARSALARARLTWTEAALADSQQELQEIFDSSLVAILTFDMQGKMQLINRAALDILGIATAEDTQGFTLFGRGYLSDEVQERVRGGGPAHEVMKYDFDYVAEHGLYAPTRTGVAFLEGSIAPLSDTVSGKVRGYVAQFEEVTERVRNERAVKAQRDLARAVLATDSLEDALDHVLSTVLEATDLDVGGIYVYDSETGRMTLMNHKGISEEFARDVRQYDRDDPRSRLVLEGQALYTSYEEVPKYRADAYSEGLKGFAIVPLVVGSEVLGCMNLASHTLEEIPVELRSIIESLAAEAAQAIQREMASAALKEERTRFKSILDALPVGMVLLDAEGHLLMQNKASSELTKLTSDQEKNRTDSSPDWETTDWEGSPLPLSETPFVKVLTEAKPCVGVRLSAIDGHGNRLYVSESSAPIFNASGEIEAVLLTLEDMTDLRNALVSVRQAESFYRETVESLNEGLWVLDADDNTTFVSDRMAAMLGYTPDEMVGKKAFSFFDEAGKERLMRKLDLRHKGIAEDYDLEFVRKDGTRMQAYLAAAPILDDKGEYIGAHAGVMDITERKGIERQLEESNTLYRTQFETSPDGITVTDLQGNIVSASRRTAEMHGYESPHELEGVSALDLIVPEQRDLALENLFKTLEEGSIRGFEYEMLKKDGSTFHGGLNAAVLRDAEGNPTGFIGTTRDMTQRKEWDEALSRLNTELEAYAHAVSHDLRGPISALIASTGILRSAAEQVADKDIRSQLDEVAEVMRGSAERAYDLVSKLLLMAESGQQPQQVEDVSISAVVDSILREKTDEIEKKGVKIKVDPDLGRVVADPTHIYQLFSNLISNGLKHNDAAEPELAIARLSDSGEVHHFRVCDNGSGISEDLMERAFEPFARGDKGGAGLGLSIVKKVAAVYGGEVTVHNDGGACFEVTLRNYSPD